MKITPGVPNWNYWGWISELKSEFVRYIIGCSIPLVSDWKCIFFLVFLVDHSPIVSWRVFLKFFNGLCPVLHLAFFWYTRPVLWACASLSLLLHFSMPHVLLHTYTHTHIFSHSHTHGTPLSFTGQMVLPIQILPVLSTLYLCDSTCHDLPLAH